jgi:hypothetical protein
MRIWQYVDQVATQHGYGFEALTENEARAAEAVRSGDLAHRLVGRPTLLLDVPLTSEAELAFIRSLCSRTTEMLAVVPAADEPTLTRLRQVPVKPRHICMCLARARSWTYQGFRRTQFGCS